MPYYSADGHRATANVRDRSGRAAGLTEAAASLLGSGVELRAVHVRPADHRVDNMTTEALRHVHVDTDRGHARLFAKVLRPATKSPLMAFIPVEHHAEVTRHLNWLDEPRLYRSGIGADLPRGLRLPELHGVAESDDRIVLWLEDVPTTGQWTLERYRLASRLLGGAAARWPEGRLAEQNIGRRSYAYLFFGKILNADVPTLRAPGHWGRLDLDGVDGERLGERTERLIAAAPRLLGIIADLPHALAHGDATPHNLLLTPNGDLVAVDCSYGCADAIGADLAQLLAGRFDVGDADPTDVPAVADAVLAGFLDGIRDEGLTSISERDVTAAWGIALAFRSVIAATALDHRPDLSADDRAAMLAQRVAVADFGLSLLEECQLI